MNDTEVMLRVQMEPRGRHTDLHIGAVPRFVGFKPNGTLSVWYVCTLDAFNSSEREVWGFVVAATGEPTECPYPYLGSGISPDGLVFHVYGGKL